MVVLHKNMKYAIGAISVGCVRSSAKSREKLFALEALVFLARVHFFLAHSHSNLFTVQ